LRLPAGPPVAVQPRFPPHGAPAALSSRPSAGAGGRPPIAGPWPGAPFRPPGAGQPLPATIPQKAEGLFRGDLASVRIHVVPEAAASGALALTPGSDIYFAPGHYQPGSAHGERLLAHELTHVVQQRMGRARNPFGSGVALVQDPVLEAEAERMSH